MTLRVTLIALVAVLAACASHTPPVPTATVAAGMSTPTPTAQPTATPPPATPRPTPDTGTVAGRVCYPSSEPPPMAVTLENINTRNTVSLDVARGQITYTTALSPGTYTAVANTKGMHLWGGYTCNNTQPCPFEIEAGQTTTVNLCNWYSPPGILPPRPNQAEDEVNVRLVQNMHARTGPHLSYPELGLVKAGTVLPALSRSADDEWLRVEHPELGVTGWLHAPLLQIMGNPAGLPVASGASDNKQRPIQFTPAIWQSGPNGNIVQFKGSIRDKAGRPVNGYSVFVDNGTWSVISHPTGASRHYPDVGDGLWDVVIPNETDAAGWWTLTVVRYECPDFEIGFNGQCKQFTPLSETKVVKVVHPDENIIEANWTCLEDCNQGLYLKPYRHPVAPVPNHLLLYVEDRVLKTSPPSPISERVQIKSIYDSLPDTPDGLKSYLAQNRPQLSPDGRHLIIPDPTGNVTWLARLDTGHLLELSRPAAPAAWSPNGNQIAYFKNNGLYVFDLSTGRSTKIWQQAGLRSPSITWRNQITVETAGAAWRISADGQSVTECQPQETAEPAVTAYLAEQDLPPPSAWATSHSGQQIAFSVSLLGNPLKNIIAILNLKTQTHTIVGPINGYRVPEIRWTANDDLLLIGATNPKFPSGGAIFTMEPKPNTLPDALLESDTAYLVDLIPQAQ